MRRWRISWPLVDILSYPLEAATLEPTKLIAGGWLNQNRYVFVGFCEYPKSAFTKEVAGNLHQQLLEAKEGRSLPCHRNFLSATERLARCRLRHRQIGSAENRYASRQIRCNQGCVLTLFTTDQG